MIGLGGCSCLEISWRYCEILTCDSFSAQALPSLRRDLYGWYRLKVLLFYSNLLKLCVSTSSYIVAPHPGKGLVFRIYLTQTQPGPFLWSPWNSIIIYTILQICFWLIYHIHLFTSSCSRLRSHLRLLDYSDSEVLWGGVQSTLRHGETPVYLSYYDTLCLWNPSYLVLSSPQKLISGRSYPGILKPLQRVLIAMIAYSLSMKLGWLWRLVLVEVSAEMQIYSS